MLKSQLSSTFLPAQTSLLSSIQRAKERIFSKSSKSQNGNNISTNNNIDRNKANKDNLQAIDSKKQQSKATNNENNSLSSNLNFPIFAESQLQNRMQQKTKYLQSQSSRQQQLKITKQSLSTKIRNSPKEANNLNQTNNNSNIVVANAIKLLQQKIHQLQSKNKLLEQKVTVQKRDNQNIYQKDNDNMFTEQKNNPYEKYQNVPLTTIQKLTQKQYCQSQQQQSDLKSYLVLKQQCESLQKENASLNEELSKQKDTQYFPIRKQTNGRKLNFHHEISQNVSQVFLQEQKPIIIKKQLSLQGLEQTIKEMKQKLCLSEKQKQQYKSQLQSEKKRNFTILKLHQQQIIRNQQLQLETKQLKQKIKESIQKEQYRKRSSNINKIAERRGTGSNNNTNILSETNNISQIYQKNNKQHQSTMMRQKHQQLQKVISSLKEQIQQQKIFNQQKTKQNTEIYQKYLEVKESFIQLYKDLLKYHPQVVNANIKFLYERIRKGEDIMLKSRSMISGGYSRKNNYNRLSAQNRNGINNLNSTNNIRLSEFRSKSGKKGLKMEDLNSSKRSQSRDRTNSKNSNRSISKSKSKSGYRSPYAQQNAIKRLATKSVLSPTMKPIRHRSTTITANQQDNKIKLSQIQKIIKEIKQVSRQIKAIKSQHRNLSVKIGTSENSNDQSDLQETKNQYRMNELIEEYNQKNAKLQELKLQKDRLALETVPDGLL